MSSPQPVPPVRWKLSIAPMMDWTDRHCRYFHRLLTRHALRYNVEEHPIALQLGGNEPVALAICAKLGGNGVMTSSTLTAVVRTSGCSVAPLEPA